MVKVRKSRKDKKPFVHKPIFEERMVTVTDDWHPCYDNNQIRLKIALLYDYSRNTFFVRVCAWGNDDFGVEKDGPETFVSKPPSLSIRFLFSFTSHIFPFKNESGPFMAV